MPTVSGVSTLGGQRLVGRSVPPINVYSVGITNFPVVPFKRIGYLYIFAYVDASPFQSYLVAAVPLYRPGVYGSIPTPSLPTGFAYFMEATWDAAGLSWTATLA